MVEGAVWEDSGEREACLSFPVHWMEGALWGSHSSTQAGPSPVLLCLHMVHRDTLTIWLCHVPC